MSLIESNKNELGIELYWRFTDAAVDAAPDVPGVFGFFDESGHLLILGSAVKSLKTVLRTHWKGYEGGSTCGATYVGLEVSDKPLQREAELATAFARRHGRMPRRQAG